MLRFFEPAPPPFLPRANPHLAVIQWSAATKDLSSFVPPRPMRKCANPSFSV